MKVNEEKPFDWAGTVDVCPTCGKDWSSPRMVNVKEEVGPRFSTPIILGLAESSHPRWWCGTWPCTMHLDWE